MTCEETQDLLHGYIDGELDLLRNIEIERHMNGCQTCSAARQAQLALRSALSESSLYYVAPDHFQRQVRTALRAENKTVFAPRSISRHWLAVAASLAIVALSGIAICILISNRSRSGGDDLVAQEIVSSHVRSLMVNHLTDVVSSDQHTVKPWFDGMLDFAPQVKDLTNEGFPLIGGRIDYLGNRAVVALVYQRQKHYINLFIWPSEGGPDSRERTLTRQGYNLVFWNESGMTYWAVSDLNSRELREFATLIKNSRQPKLSRIRSY